MGGKIFISYRREDDPSAAARVRMLWRRGLVKLACLWFLGSVDIWTCGTGPKTEEGERRCTMNFPWAKRKKPPR